jgi:hypothetical protein
MCHWKVHWANDMFAWLISHKSVVFFSQNKIVTSNQSTVHFSQNKSAPAISHLPNEQSVNFYVLHTIPSTFRSKFTI